jgi:hypothetical protein
MTLSLLKSTLPSYKVVLCPVRDSDWSSGVLARLIDRRNSSEVPYDSLTLTVTKAEAWAMVLKQGTRLRLPVEFCNVTPTVEAQRA